MKRLSFFSALVATSLAILPINAEIERVLITWTAIECTDQCIKEMEKQFRRIPAVAGINIDKPSGRVELTYKPNAPFAFYPINTAMELVGITINNIRVRAKGTIHHDAYHVTLISNGDGTKFDLINPVVPTATNQAVQFNVGARKLQPALRQKLLDAETERDIVTIDGPILFPERSPPIELVVDNLTITKKPEPSKTQSH